MDKEQKKALIKGWELENKILRELRDLAEMNITLAYGCIRTAETMIDMIAVAQFQGFNKKEE